ncbi:NAD(P)-dependent alcohol dehydrogenase [Imtechella halotolerans]|nr:NAD(P)-dependent alcohol dehydrogenase [Imtechella halotolerans]WMQ64671.1 NAD(P)-dependent alcohol dehydrogenase [Imtechella halotolerans]
METTMRAVICTKYGPPEVLQIKEVSKPTPKAHQVLIKIMATAVNSGDVRIRKLDANGLMKMIMQLILGFSSPRKSILGTVYSGVVESIGNKVTHFKIGDDVFGMTGLNFGTYSEYITVHQKSNIVQMPRNATYQEAAAIIFGGQTAIHFLNKAKISTKKQPEVLIIGGTGSVGSAAIQIAKYYKVSLTSVCSSEGEDLVRSLGVTNRILYDKEDFTKHTQKYDIIFDAVGKYHRKMCKRLLNKNGVYLSVKVGYASETKYQLELLKELFEKGEYKALIDKTFRMEEVVEAHRYVETGRKKGNVILKIR